MVLPEKIVTMMQRGTANIRWRDFVDVYTLSRQHPLNGDELRESMIAVANHRQADLAPLEAALTGFAPLAQPKWAAWRHRQRLEQQAPESFSNLVTAICAFADPVITGQAEIKFWQPETLAWDDAH